MTSNSAPEKAFGLPSLQSAEKDMMMRVAVAGTNSLALLIAHFLVKETSHQVLVLSRFVSLLDNSILSSCWSSLSSILI
jgi:hypothetical protein